MQEGFELNGEIAQILNYVNTRLISTKQLEKKSSFVNSAIIGCTMRNGGKKLTRIIHYIRNTGLMLSFILGKLCLNFYHLQTTWMESQDFLSREMQVCLTIIHLGNITVEKQRKGESSSLIEFMLIKYQ